MQTCIFCGRTGAIEKTFAPASSTSPKMTCTICNPCYMLIPVDIHEICINIERITTGISSAENVQEVIKLAMLQFLRNWNAISPPTAVDLIKHFNRIGLRTERGRTWSTQNVGMYILRHFEGRKLMELYQDVKKGNITFDSSMEKVYTPEVVSVTSVIL